MWFLCAQMSLFSKTKSDRSTSALQENGYRSSREGSAGLVTLQGVPTVNCSRTYFSPHRLVRSTVELEASNHDQGRRGAPRRAVSVRLHTVVKGLDESL